MPNRTASRVAGFPSSWRIALSQPEGGRCGSYLLRLPYTDHRELIMDILKHGAHCEVLGPATLRRVMGEEVKKMDEKYFSANCERFTR